MKFILLTILFVASLTGCFGRQLNGLESGYYVMSKDKQMDFFCSRAFTTQEGIVGSNCVDMTCNYFGDNRIRGKISIRDGIVLSTSDFNYKLVPCGEGE